MSKSKFRPVYATASQPLVLTANNVKLLGYDTNAKAMVEVSAVTNTSQPVGSFASTQMVAVTTVPKTGNFTALTTQSKYVLSNAGTAITLNASDPDGTTYSFWDASGTCNVTPHTFLAFGNALINGNKKVVFNQSYGHYVAVKVGGSWVIGGAPVGITNIPTVPTASMIGYFIGEEGITDTGGNISQWARPTDYGPFTYDSVVTAGDSSNHPIVDTTTLAGKKGVKFDNTTTWQSLTSSNSPALPASFTAHAVVVGQDSNGVGSNVFFLGGRSISWPGNVGTKASASDGYWSSSTNTPSNGSPQLISLRAIVGGSPDGLFEVYLNGTLIGTSHDSGNNPYSGKLTIGGNPDNGNRSANMTLYALALYSSTQASGTDFQDTITALKGFYGIA